MVLWWFVDQFLSCCLLDIKKSLFSLSKYTASAASQAFAAYKGEMWWWHWDGRRQLLRPEMGKVVEICWTWHGSEKRTCRIHLAMRITASGTIWWKCRPRKRQCCCCMSHCLDAIAAVEPAAWSATNPCCSWRIYRKPVDMMNQIESVSTIIILFIQQCFNMF